MKKLVITLTITLMVIACGEKNDGFVLNGTLRGDVADGTKVFLKTAGENNTIIEVDTATITAGNFTFKGEPKSLEPHVILLENSRDNMMLFIENGTIELSAHKDSLRNVSIIGTTQNDVFTSFKEESKAIGEKGMSIQSDYQKAVATQDTATIKALQEEMQEIQEEGKTFEIAFAKENPNAVISGMIINRMYASKIISDEEAKEMLNNLTEEVKNTKAAKSLIEALEASKSTAIGAKAPEFSAPTPSGEDLALKDALGKVTIIDFWAAWCVPCRQENPNVVNVYNKYHEKGLNIIGVSLDKNAEEWKKAIAEDGLTWYQVYNEKNVQEIAQLYSVNAIPSTFILDENGVIIAKNLRGKALEDKMAELLQ
ncbi:AhpC/TSA family protein [Cellulophaga sp. F20128]|uniref:TlpA disulfide reductase family protein n=1 Tax=Cellulophaga sp. F20128 TaxID=2926413 RepID=UPI001FF686B9|nr:TlpA disulfide reductase family protein [Cellulophaga sp. F20128]MCK0158185.1 AhpC/TSA family protein [Cellulophaga sp. F20128]